jgi:hypothetical protein
LQTNAVHYYQRPDATHLGVDPNATSLSGHGGSVLFGRSDKDRFRLTDHFHWYSPGLELNDLGYLRQADLLANQVFLGWSEPKPGAVFREYSLQLSREDQRDFGGLQTKATTGFDGSALFRNKWRATGRFGFEQVVDTRALRGGPALRWHDYFFTGLQVESDPSRRAWFLVHGEHSWAVGDDTRYSSLASELRLRPSNRLSLSAAVSYEQLVDNLQYVTTASVESSPRYVLARILQDTWSLTLRANLSITPDLTIQYYGSPFLGTGRYTAFKKGTDTLAKRYEDRFHLYSASEIAYDPAGNRYQVAEAQGPSYAFDNPDFSFRQFRSNLVARWEYRPGSALYVVWSQGRTGSVATWESSWAANWNALWDQRPDNVFFVKVSYWFSP